MHAKNRRDSLESWKEHFVEIIASAWGLCTLKLVPKWGLRSRHRNNLFLHTSQNMWLGKHASKTLEDFRRVHAKRSLHSPQCSCPWLFLCPLHQQDLDASREEGTSPSADGFKPEGSALRTRWDVIHRLVLLTALGPVVFITCSLALLRLLATCSFFAVTRAEKEPLLL